MVGRKQYLFINVRSLEDYWKYLNICLNEIITLCNKDSGEWDISTDFTSLGLTNTQMNTLLHY